MSSSGSSIRLYIRAKMVLQASTAANSISTSEKFPRMCSATARNSMRVVCLLMALLVLNRRSGAKFLYRLRRLTPLLLPPVHDSCRMWASMASPTTKNAPTTPMRSGSTMSAPSSPTTRCCRLGATTLQATTTTISGAPTSTSSRLASWTAISVSTTRRATPPPTTTRPRATIHRTRRDRMWKISTKTIRSTSTNATISTAFLSATTNCRPTTGGQSRRSRTSSTIVTIMPNCAMATLSPCAGTSTAFRSWSSTLRWALSTTSLPYASCECSSPDSVSPSCSASDRSTWCGAHGDSISRVCRRRMPRRGLWPSVLSMSRRTPNASLWPMSCRRASRGPATPTSRS